MAAKKATKKPKAIKPVGKQARNIVSRKQIPKADPPPKPTDTLFDGLVEAGQQALATHAYEKAEEHFFEARMVGATLKKASDSPGMVAARKGYLFAFARLLEEEQR